MRRHFKIDLKLNANFWKTCSKVFLTHGVILGPASTPWNTITFYFHYDIWGCMCSTGPFQYRWLKGYIYSSCYHHHQIGSIHLSHCYHIFPWLCAWDVFIIIVQFMMSANSRIRFALHIVLVCLYNTPSHYHHCAELSEDIELIKCLSDIFCRVCE